MTVDDEITIICAIDQGFSIDVKFQPWLKEMETLGLIEPVHSWKVTQKGWDVYHAWEMGDPE